MSIDAFSEYFSELKDPRQTAKISYLLFDVLFLTVCAVIAGAEGWEDIEDFGEFISTGSRKRGCFLTVYQYTILSRVLFLVLSPHSFSNALFIGLNPSINGPKVS